MAPSGLWGRTGLYWDMAHQTPQDTTQANNARHLHAPWIPKDSHPGKGTPHQHCQADQKVLGARLAQHSLSEIPCSLPAPKGPCLERQTQAADPKNAPICSLQLLRSYSEIFLGTDRNLLLLFLKKIK